MKTYSEFIGEGIDPGKRQTLKLLQQASKFKKELGHFMKVVDSEKSTLEAAFGGRTGYTNFNSDLSDVFVKLDELMAAIR